MQHCKAVNWAEWLVFVVIIEEIIPQDHVEYIATFILRFSHALIVKRAHDLLPIEYATVHTLINTGAR